MATAQPIDSPDPGHQASVGRLPRAIVKVALEILRVVGIDMMPINHVGKRKKKN
jgi:hypothetical protein